MHAMPAYLTGEAFSQILLRCHPSLTYRYPPVDIEDDEQYITI
jgi:hypothetical protein